MLSLTTPIEKVSRIGPVYQKKLKKFGIHTVKDLLFHFPHRYEDFSNIGPIAAIKINERCTIQGRIAHIENTRTWKKKIMLTHALVEDDTGPIKAVWFNQPYLSKTLKKGDTVVLSGKVVFGKEGVYLSNPVYEKTDLAPASQLTPHLIHTGRLVPIYPESRGLSSRWIRYMISSLLLKLKGAIPETLPETVIKEHNFMNIQEALWHIHFPDSQELAKKAQARFSFEELFLIALFVLRERAKLAQEKAAPLPTNLATIKRFVNALPFKLTDAQKKSAWRILKDLEMPRPMNRLLQGDVGSGKTVVATIAALNTIKAGYQVAFMVPTEILAKQHFQGVAKLLEDFKVNIGLLTGKQDQFRSKKLKNDVIEISREKLLVKTLEGDIDILIGTHALIQDTVKFGNLALVVLDEQHRFGVEQRAKLVTHRNREERIIPHLLSMTATPIPRTLALTIYGDLDLALIDELPTGRKKIITKIVAPADRTKAYDFIRNEAKKGRQVFVVCPRIEPGDKEAIGEEKDPFGWAFVKAVKEEYEKLSKEIFPRLKVEQLHGKMATKEKEKVMKNFKNKKIDILVSTSVIEVGIDIPNATVMMIEGADRFGLAQLHQFRGRVGRSGFQSYCFLFTDSPSRTTRQRLHALVKYESGFALAERDLKIRGPGEFSGTHQWGIPDFAMNSLTNIKLVEQTREAAKQLLQRDPYLQKYPLLREKLGKFRERIHLE